MAQSREFFLRKPLVKKASFTSDDRSETEWNSLAESLLAQLSNIPKDVLQSERLQHRLQALLDPNAVPLPPPGETPPKFKKPTRTRSSAPDGKPDAIVIVDPLSTGARLAQLAIERGYQAIRLWSADNFPDELKRCVPEALVDSPLEYAAELEYSGDIAATIASLRELPLHIQGVIVGCESGVEVCDAVSAAFDGVPSNGTANSAARRDKYLMGEAVRNAGLRAVQQVECTSWLDEALPFLRDTLGVPATSVPGARAGGHGSAWCVLKPTRSAGTDGVYIAKDLAEAERRFKEIFGGSNVFGGANTTVLCQEFLAGTEYVIDSVSLEGEHKCVAIWEYDKRPCNDAQFVYFGMRLYESADGAREDAMVKYVHSVIDALGVRHGPTHAEVMWLAGEEAPCLIEVGARPHGGEGTFVDMVEQPIGYNVLSVMLDTIESPYRFRRLPVRPAPLKGGAMEVCLVSRDEGYLVSWSRVDEVRALPSFKTIELKLHRGERLVKTVDFMTTPGSVMLVHEDKAVVEANAETIHEMEQNGLYSFTERRLRLDSL